MTERIPSMAYPAVRALWWLLGAIVLVRLLTLGMYPLTDTTEARYAEIARVMLATGNWITPQLEPGVAFWGKPPLYAWLTAISFAVFGVNEFAARLPQFLLSVGVLALVWRLVRDQTSQRHAQLSVIVLASSVMFFVAAGAVMTDMALLFCTTLAMTGFWLAATLNSRAWSRTFFAALGLGLLAKGPVAVVLIAFPVIAWWVIFGRRQPVRLPGWRGGIALAGVIALPWYVLAELRTPGFLHYFVIGEHVLRYLQPDWQGDLYGSAHDYPYGTIWLFAILAALPWTPILAVNALRRLRSGAQIRFGAWRTMDAWTGYLLLWLLSPLLFFTLAGNVLPAYVLPGLPALSVFVAWALRSARQIVLAAASIPLLFIIFVAGYNANQIPLRTEKTLIKTYENQVTNASSELFFVSKVPLSAAFYGAGNAQLYPEQQGSGARSAARWIAVAPHDRMLLPAACKRVPISREGRFELHHCASGDARVPATARPGTAAQTRAVRR